MTFSFKAQHTLAGSPVRLLLLCVALLTTLTACGDKGGSGDKGSNVFAVRKASIDSYMTAIEAAGDYDKAVVAGKAWIETNLPAYKTNCTQLVVDRQDLSKGDLAKGHKTSLDAYVARLHKIAGHDTKKMDMAALKRSALLQKQLHSFWSCDTVLKP